jgi:hypothetical protein
MSRLMRIPYRWLRHLNAPNECAEEAIRLYQWRFQIETLFSDQKSRGFHIHKSHIAAPKRLSRLLMAVSLAYLWVIYLGTQSLRHG